MPPFAVRVERLLTRRRLLPCPAVDGTGPVDGVDDEVEEEDFDDDGVEGGTTNNDGTFDIEDLGESSSEGSWLTVHAIWQPGTQRASALADTMATPVPIAQQRPLPAPQLDRAQTMRAQSKRWPSVSGPAV